MRMSQPGPPGQATAQWRRWLFPAAFAAGFLTLLSLPRGAAPGTALSYTRFLTDVGAGTVRTMTINPAGQVTGSLADGQPFTTTIPVALAGMDRHRRRGQLGDGRIRTDPRSAGGFPGRSRRCR